ncbi:MAG: aspartate-semialdehyde dehydrogenase [Ignavibacteria bacterium GWB2_35_12]|nr:MAG: aspartate-semialdehyde dehydrogenase [Ignavibacteria bacterium GWB2_35_12]OGU94017.1 MAG: aspartate-semialdehyde dehydrogenase [Ignavibacteria bacterium RIFOXYA2_FULL_35_10]OGV22874.1 MAG: aspartate-semialdehyde dehydrogenase [Ignavibacteria bacterium RIFOXYC2_FULL_35_21]
MIDGKYNIAVVGAGGLVGRTMVKVLEERKFPVNELFLFATERSAGKKVNYNGKDIEIKKINKDSFKDIDIALFSAGKQASMDEAPLAAKSGCIVIDNGSYWRMHEKVPLVVPEVNPDAIKEHKGIIANPNCSTIQLVVALKPIQEHFGLKRVVVSTYQSISGAGQKGVDKLMSEINDKNEASGQKHKVAFNTIFHEFVDDSGFSIEETKMLNEIRKIMSLPELPLAVTCVRLPTLGGHSESVNIETEKSLTLEALRECLSLQKGLTIIDNPKNDEYPTPQIAGGTDDVYVGRIRMDDSVKNGAYLWVVSDNLRKGAATNAVQIAELLVEKNLFEFNTFV